MNFIHHSNRFTMDSGTAITGAIIIAICILPFFFLGRGEKKRKKELFQSLSNLAAKQNGQISQHEAWGHSAIGLDASTHTLYFIRREKDQGIVREIPLAAIQKCKAVNTSRTAGNNQKVIEKLEMCLTPVAKGAPDIFLEFYNAENDLQLTREIQILENWVKIATDK